MVFVSVLTVSIVPHPGQQATDWNCVRQLVGRPTKKPGFKAGLFSVAMRSNLRPVAAVRLNDLRRISFHWINVIMRVLKVMRHMVVILGQNPLVHGWLLASQTGCCALRIFLR